MALTDIDGQRLGDSVADKLGDRNLIINGAMQVAQRGTSSITAGFATVDRFEAGFNGGAVTQSQGTLTTGAGDEAVYNLGFRHYLRQTNTTATSGNSDHRNIRYRPEGQDITTSGWNYTSSTSYITFSFWVRSSVSQEFYGYIRTENGTERIYTFSTGTLAADTWTKVTKTIPGDSNLEIPNDNTSGLQMFIAPFWGASFTDPGVTLDTWRNYDTALRTPEYATSWITTTNATFDLTGVQLEVGNTATPFQHRSYADELRRCQRYFYRIAGNTTDQTAVAIAYCYDPTNGDESFRAPILFPTTMRSDPAVTASDLFILHTASNDISVDSVTGLDESIYGCGLTLNTSSSSFASLQSGLCRLDDTASAHISFDAEL